MKSKNLTIAMRDHIKNALLEHRFQKDWAALKEEERRLADKAWRRLVKNCGVKRIAEVPTGWLPQKSGVAVRVHGGAAAGSYTRLKLPEDRGTPAKVGDCIVVDVSDPLGKEVDDLILAREQTDEAARALRTEVKAALNEIRTTKQLRDQWPEAAGFLPEGAAPAQVPAIPVADLNKKLGLATA